MRVRLAAVLLMLLASLRADDMPKPDGTVFTTGGSATPGSSFSIPVTISLNADKTIDTLSFGVSIEPIGAPKLSAPLVFVQESSLPRPSATDNTQVGQIAIAWLSGLSISGTHSLGQITVNVPGDATSGQSYKITVTGDSATSGMTALKVVPGPDSFLTVTQTGASFSIVSGNNQTATIGSTLGPFVVQLKDTASNPVPNATVSFAISSGGGTLSAASQTTGADGKASTTLKLGNTSGTTTVTALTGAFTAVFSAFASPGPATTIDILSGDKQSAAVGTPFTSPLIVKVKDSFGNAVPGVNVTFSVSGAAATLSTTSASTDNDGQAQVVLTAGNTPGNVTVTATSSVGTKTFSETIVKGAPAKVVIVSGDNQNGVVNTALANPLVVRVTDSGGNNVSGVTVAFVSATGAATVSASTVPTDTNGLAQVTVTLGTASGPATIRAGIGALIVTFTATVTPGPLASLMITSGNGQIGVTSSVLPNPIFLKAADQYGNGISGIVAILTVIAGSGMVKAPSVTTGSDGYAQIIWTLGTAGENRLAITVGTFTAIVTATAFPPNILTLSPGSLAFNGVVGATIAGQTLSILSPSGGSWTATASGGSWLSVSSSAGTIPASITVNVNTAGLAAGTYRGSVNVAASGMTQVADVTLILTGTTSGPAIGITPATLSFSALQGGSVSGTQTFNISNPGSGDLLWVATPRTTSGGNWLSVSPQSGLNAGVVTVTVDTARLASGAYIGSILVTGATPTIASQSVAVTLTIAAGTRPVILLSSPLLQFTSALGVSPPSKTILIQNAGPGALGWMATATTDSGGGWLSVTPLTGIAPSTLTISVNAASLAKGAYTGKITIAALDSANAINSPQTLRVEFAAGAPLIGKDGVVNGASFSTDAIVSTSSIASLFGVNLASTTDFAAAVPLPTVLAGAMVLVDTVPAPLFFVSPGQINFQMPGSAAGNTVQVQVVSDTAGTSQTVRVAPAVPGIFTFVPGGTGQAAVLNQDSSANGAATPATAGSVIQIFVTGLGSTDPPLPAGQPGASAAPFNNTILTPQVLIGGQPAELLFSAAAPGFVGLYQVNARVPSATAASGSVSLQIQIGGRISNLVTIAVK